MKLKNNKGITLIALVITIIVLLILAGVSIASLSGQNGILTKAGEAKTTNAEKSAKEAVEMVLDEWQIEKHTGSQTLEEFLNSKKTEGNLDDVKKNEDGTFEVEKDEYLAIVNADGIITSYDEIVSVITATGNLTDTTKIKEVREGNIPIPVGFTYVKGIKKAGAVVTDGTSEFVWVPVGDITKMATLKEGSQTNYRGILYDWISDQTGKTAYSWSASRFREPDNLGTNYDNVSNITGWTSTLYQEEYNKMVASVSKYGGFYVGRYETSFNGTTPQSKRGETSATAADSSQAWYGLYNKQKNYSVGSTKGQMIWGSQYDAMLKWMQENSINVTSTTGTTRNQGTTTGTVESDKLNNIYDILGNRREWTAEANYTNYRVNRGRLLQRH